MEWYVIDDTSTSTKLSRECYQIIFGVIFIFLFTEIGDTELSRKISLCEELLEVAKILEPGESIFRGKLLVDLQEALFVQTERLNDRRDISNVIAKASCSFLLNVSIKLNEEKKNAFHWCTF